LGDESFPRIFSVLARATAARLGHTSPPAVHPMLRLAEAFSVGGSAHPIGAAAQSIESTSIRSRRPASPHGTADTITVIGCSESDGKEGEDDGNSSLHFACLERGFLNAYRCEKRVSVRRMEMWFVNRITLEDRSDVWLVVKGV